MTPSTEPSVTVVVPCYNAAPYLPALFASMSEQTEQAFEVVFFDDGSSDATPMVLADLSAQRPGARVERRSDNRGVCCTLNAALVLVNTPYTIIFAADDVMLPRLVEVALAAIERHDHDVAAVAFPHVVGDDMAQPVLDEDGRPVVYAASPELAHAETSTVLETVLEANRFAGVALFRTEVIRSLGYDEELSIEDWDMWARIVARWRVVVASEPMFVYRNTADSLDKRLRRTGRRYVDAARLRAKFVGSSPSIDRMVVRRTKVDLHLLLSRGQKAETRAVLAVLRTAGLSEPFRRERLALLLPVGCSRLLAAVRHRRSPVDGPRRV